jgi:ATP-dependent Clp protease ATP-binding subunit ClpA
MFERYTEKARRTIFFARYEASQVGCPTIGTDHLLLGLLRESGEIVRLHLKLDRSALAERLRSNTTIQQKIATSVDLPLDDDSKHALAYAAEEASEMGHKFIGTEHLLLGIMREERSPAAKTLREMGAPAVSEVRKSARESAVGDESRSGTAAVPGYPMVMKLVEEGSGKELSVRLRFMGVPRIGEAVTVTLRDGETARYRVVDVGWGFEGGSLGDDLALNAIELLVRREDQAAS